MTHACRVCKSTHIVKNGTNRCGKAQYHCKDCGTYRVLTPKQAYSESEQCIILRACLERCSLRGVARIFAVARQTIARWLKAHVQKLPDVKETLLPAAADDVLELDEIWSVVQKKAQKRWVWTAMCRRSRQIVAFVTGDPAKRPAFVSGRRFRRATNTVTPSVIFGKPTNTFSQLKPIGVLGRKLGTSPLVAFRYAQRWRSWTDGFCYSGLGCPGQHLLHGPQIAVKLLSLRRRQRRGIKRRTRNEGARIA
jgi:transposase-like protein